jgi:Domain of unknown function (DUF4388)
MEMSLAGNLRQYALVDLLRAIESEQRGGRLMLQRGERRAFIYFSGGQWLLVERVGSSLVLAHHLARVGLITPEQFESSLGVPFVEAGQIPDVQVVRALITSRQLSQEQLRAFAENDALDLLAHVLSWPDGDFAFEDGVALPPGRVALPLPVGQLIAQVQQVRGSTPPPRPTGPVAAVAPISPQTVIDFAEVDPANGETIQLTRDQWRLLTAVDGQAPLVGIMQKLQAPEHVIMRLASELLAAGTMVVVDHP